MLASPGISASVILPLPEEEAIPGNMDFMRIWPSAILLLQHGAEFVLLSSAFLGYFL